MRHLVSLTLLLCLIPAAPAADPALKEVDAVVEEALKVFHAPGVSVAVVRDDVIVHLQGYGVRQAGKEGAVGADTTFAIASCTKAFTATGIALLIDDGKLRWDDPVRKYLDYFHLKDPLADRDVTLRDLLCHRTGVTRHDLLRHIVPNKRDEILRRLTYLEPTYAFRTRFEYNNLMYLAAGEAAASANKSSWEELTQKRIFNVLDMKTAVCSTGELKKDGDNALPHRRDAKGKIEELPLNGVDTIGPAGSIHASARDMARWVRFQLGDGTVNNERVLAARHLQEMHRPQMVVRLEGRWTMYYPPDVTDQVSYGLGWFVHDYRGHGMVSHGGTLAGYRAQVVMVPKAKLGIVVLSNLGSTHADDMRLPEAVSRTLVDHFLKLPKRDWNDFYLKEGDAKRTESEEHAREQEKNRTKGTAPSLKLDSYCGTYEDPAYGEARLSLEKGVLTLKWVNFAFPLEHYHYDTFKAVGHAQFNSGNLVGFYLNADGRVESLTFLDRTFKRKDR